MPTLKQLTCTLEKEPSRAPLNEYGTSYSDGFVETYVAVPDEPTGFGIHLHSSGYIAPGLAMFVYIDGIYQCNRHRNNLLAPDGTITPEFYEVDFHVFQQEEKVGKGKFLGRSWSFNALNLATADNTSNVADIILGNVGTIEVVVRRLYPPPVQSVLPTNGNPVEPTFKKAGKQKEKQKGFRIKPTILPGSSGFGNDGAGDQNFGAGLDGPSDDRYYDPTSYYYHDDRRHRSRHYHHRRPSPSPPPRHDFGPSYADYLRWRDTHPDAVVPSRSREPQRSSSYYDRYRPSGSHDSTDHHHHGYTSSGHRQRHRARASDGIPQNRPRDYWVFESVNFDPDDPVPRVARIRRPPGSPSPSSSATQNELGLTQHPLLSVIDTSAAIPQARPTMQSPNPFDPRTDGLPSYRVGQPDGSLDSSKHRPDPMFNPRYPPEAALLQNHNSGTNGHDGTSKMPGAWLGQDPKDSAKAPSPIINEEPSGSRLDGGVITSFPAADDSKWGVVDEHGQNSGGQESGWDSTAADGAGQGDTWGPSGDNSAGQNDAWGASGDNSVGQDSTWGTSGGDNTGGDNLGGGTDQTAPNDFSADSGGWGPTSVQEQTSQQIGGECGGTRQDSGNSGAQPVGNWANDGVDNTNNPPGQNDISGDAEKNTDQDDRWGPQDNATDNSSTKNNEAMQDTSFNWPSPDDNTAQQAATNNDSNWGAQATALPAEQLATAPTDQSIAVPKAESLHKGSNKDSKTFSNPFMYKQLVPEQPFVKSYWNNWTKAPLVPPALPQRQPKQSEDAPSEIFAPSEVPYVVPEQTAREKLVDSYVHHGKGYDYAHVTGRPDYIDSWEEPYAVFRFKYRSRSMLSQILGRKGKEEMEKDQARERDEEQKRRLSLLSKDELIQHLMEKSAESQKAGGSVASQPQPVQQWANTVAAATAPGSKAGSSADEPMTCDRCKGNLVGQWWHCGLCEDYDICCICVEKNFRCNDNSHDLIQWKDNVDLGNNIKGIKSMDKKLPGIQKSSDNKDGNAGGGSNNNDTVTNQWNSDFVGNATSNAADNAAGGEWGAIDPAVPTGGTGGDGNGNWNVTDAGAGFNETKPKWDF